MKAENTELFENAPVSKAVISLVIPTIISQIIFVIYNMADTFFIGQLGDPNQVAAATLSMPPFVLLTGIANLFGIGGASLISRCLGQGNKEKAKHCSAFSIWSATVISLLYGIIIFAFRSVIFPILGADSNTYSFCMDYIFWTITIGGIPTVLNACLGHLVRSEGYSKQASIGMALGGIINMILDPVFIFALGFEIAGAAIATMLSNTAATIYFIILLYKKRNATTIIFSPKYYTFKYKIPIDVLSVGLPSLLMIILGTVSSWTANKLVVAYSNQAVAGMGIAKKLDMLTFALANGMTQGVLPLVGYTYAAKNFKRMRSVIKTAFKYSIIVAFSCTILLYVFAVPIARFFIDDAETVAYAQHFLKIICITCPAITVTTMIITIFQATGQKIQPTILSVLKRGCVDVIFMYIMNHIMNVNGIPWATFIADCLAMLIAITFFIPYWKKMKLIELNVKKTQENTIEAENEIVTSPATHLVITIGRSYGSSGRTVGKLVAKQLGIPYYDAELLEQTAIKSGLNKKFIESIDEKPLKSSMLYGYAGFVSEQYSQIEKLANEAQREIIEKVSQKGACVIVGRRADQILKDKDNLLRIFITAPYEIRVKYIMERDELSESESKTKVKLVDKERAEYYNTFSYTTWGNANTYDLCVDTHKIGINETVNIIVRLAMDKLR